MFDVYPILEGFLINVPGFGLFSLRKRFMLSWMNNLVANTTFNFYNKVSSLLTSVSLAANVVAILTFLLVCLEHHSYTQILKSLVPEPEMGQNLHNSPSINHYPPLLQPNPSHPLKPSINISHTKVILQNLKTTSSQSPHKSPKLTQEYSTLPPAQTSSRANSFLREESLKAGSPTPILSKVRGY